MKSIRSDLPRLKLVLFSTIIFSLAAHAYMFFTFAPSHDSMVYMIVTDADIPLVISNGRFMQPVYWLLRGRLPAPWLVGMLSVLYIFLSSYLIFDALDIRRRSATILLCGIFATDIAVTATAATYLYTLDTYTLALLFATAGTYLLEKLPPWRGILAAVLCFVCCMGLYQAYIDVAIGLALLLLIRHILDGERFSSLWKRALRYGVSLLAGAVLYFTLVKFIQHLSGVAMITDYNSLNGLLESSPLATLLRIPQTYFEFVAQLLSPLRSYNTPVILLCRGLLVLVGLLLWVRCIRARHIRGLELFALLLCAALLPLGLNFIRVLDPAWVHTLMIYSFCLIYIFLLLPLELSDPPSRPVTVSKTLTVGLCAYSIVFNIIFANGAYFKKQMLYEVTSQYAFSIMEQVERNPDYEMGVTPVAVIGSFYDTLAGWQDDALFAPYRHMVGSNGTFGITTVWKFSHYCQFILGHPINAIQNEDELASMAYDPAIQSMPLFPKDGSCAMVDGVMVIKLSDPVAEE